MQNVPNFILIIINNIILPITTNYCSNIFSNHLKYILLVLLITAQPFFIKKANNCLKIFHNLKILEQRPERKSRNTMKKKRKKKKIKKWSTLESFFRKKLHEWNDASTRTPKLAARILWIILIHCEKFKFVWESRFTGLERCQSRCLLTIFPRPS